MDIKCARLYNQIPSPCLRTVFFCIQLREIYPFKYATSFALSFISNLSYITET